MNSLKSNLDATDWAILGELQHDARLSYAEIGRRVGLSSPAVQERIHKLEDANIITGYTAKINLPALGVPIKALIRLGGSCRESDIFAEAVQKMPHVLECHHVLGDDCFEILVAMPSVTALKAFIKTLYTYGETATTMVINSPIEHRIITQEILIEKDTSNGTR